MGKFGKTVDDIYAQVLEKNQKFGLLVREDGRIFLTKRGRGSQQRCNVRISAGLTGGRTGAVFRP